MSTRANIILIEGQQVIKCFSIKSDAHLGMIGMILEHCIDQASESPANPPLKRLSSVFYENANYIYLVDAKNGIIRAFDPSLMIDAEASEAAGLYSDIIGNEVDLGAVMEEHEIAMPEGWKTIPASQVNSDVVPILSQAWKLVCEATLKGVDTGLSQRSLGRKPNGMAFCPGCGTKHPDRQIFVEVAIKEEKLCEHCDEVAV